MRLFLSRFSIRIQVTARKYYRLGYAVDHPVYGVESCFSYSLLLHYNFWPISEFRGVIMKVLSRENIALSFENMDIVPAFGLLTELASLAFRITRQLSRTNKAIEPPGKNKAQDLAALLALPDAPRKG
jgi:hypothetical protein